MKKQLLGLSLFAATAIGVALYPAPDSSAGTPAVTPRTHPLPVTALPDNPLVAATPLIEVVFVLDTTGSMSGLISAAKEKTWSIASTMAQADPSPMIRMGLVAYRDRGDDYVTRVIDLSADLDSMYAALMDFRAAGGGDGPESVNKALDDAINRISWSDDDSAYKVVFLVGDAPPHMDYANEAQYPALIRTANQRNIVVNAVRCGQNPHTLAAWRSITALSQGDLFDVEQNGNAIAIATPFDADIARLSAALDDTRLAFGSATAQADHAAKQAAISKLHAGASLSSRARRAAFNASEAGARNFLGEHDLVDAVDSGRVELEALAPSALPEPLREIAPEARQQALKDRAEKRHSLTSEISKLTAKRDAFINEQLAAQGGAADSLDDKIYRTVRRQAAAAGLSYDAPAKY